MPGLDPKMVNHCMNVKPKTYSVMQRNWTSLKRQKNHWVRSIEILEAKYIEKIDYLDWLLNVIIVKKPITGRRCMDYTDLNKACPKDYYPLAKY